MTDLCWDLELLHHSKLKEHANAGFDEVELCDGEVTEGEQIEALSVDIVGRGAGSFLNRNKGQYMQANQQVGIYNVKDMQKNIINIKYVSSFVAIIRFKIQHTSSLYISF